MSIDLRLVPRSDPCPTCGHDDDADNEAWSANYTHNMGYAAYAADAEWRRQRRLPPLEGSLWATFDDMPAADVIERAEEILAYLLDPVNEKALREREPSNGWGSLDGYRSFWASFVRALKSNPTCIVKASW